MKDSALADALMTANRVSDDSYKASAIHAIATSYTTLAESSNDQALYGKIFTLIEGFRDDENRDKILNVILSSKMAVADVGRLRSLGTHYGIGAAKTRALTRILKAVSYPELISKKNETSYDDGW